ncbi:toll-like receptor 13 [Uranotaenia lowii]|uniref:toll-like receptor 13 n=1 Tax=Uranotaenia lowii TaxID=190385 RepID=UPI0024784462|nr:toll-like receptor 13 [Uranotaenia lowii]
MELPKYWTVIFCLRLVLQVTCNNVPESCDQSKRVNCNGFESFLPIEAEASYNIRLNKYQYKSSDDSECMLGNALNYMPWLFPNGSLVLFGYEARPLDLANLRLTNNALVTLISNMKTGLSVMTHVSIANNQLYDLPLEFLSSVSSVRYLSMYLNPFDDFAAESAVRPKLPPMGALEALDMRDCRIRVLRPDFFHDAPNLQYLFLSQNYISKLPGQLFYATKNLVHLDLSHMDSSQREAEVRAENPFMKFSAGMDLDSNVFEPLVKLRFLDLSFSKLELKAFIALSSLGTRLEYVSYCYTDLPGLMDYLFLMKSIKMLDLSGNPGCARALHSESFHLLRRSLEVLYFKDASIHGLEWLSGLGKLKTLVLKNNFIGKLDVPAVGDLVSLEILDISNNFVQSWSHSLFTNSTNMKLINLRSNNLQLVTNSMLRDFENMQYLALGDNNIQCSCNFVFLMRMALGDDLLAEEEANKSALEVSFLKNFSVEHLNLFDYNENDYLCMNFTSRRRVSVRTIPLCNREDEGIYTNVNDDKDYDADTLEEIIQEYTVLYIVSSIMVLLILAVIFFIYWKWFYIKYFFVLLKNSAILSFFNDDKVYLEKSYLEDENCYTYDVFVSYCDNDRNWVLDNMLPNLEQQDLITVCLHERDFEVGYGILENIISCMDRSRCLMLIVSESFLLSRWCQFEMHLAQHRLLETRRDELILVLLEDIPRRKCPKTLSYLMKTKTYIKWPSQQGTDDRETMLARELFWKRLRKALLQTK